MSDVKVTRRKLSDYRPAEVNPNKGTARGLGAIVDSLQFSGAGRSALADRDGEMIAGSHTLEAAAQAGIEDVIEIETDGRALVVVRRQDLDLTTDPKARALQLADNRTNEIGYDPDEVLIAEMLVGLAQQDTALVQAAGFDADDVRALTDDVELDVEADIPLTRYDVPDALWASDNDYDIPLLDIEMQADAVDLPLSIWGSLKRTARMNGTWAFYTDDYRFEELWRDPSPVVNTQAINIVEPNFSTTAQMPFAVCLYNIYRKRWLARWWQSRGLRVFVDLNVHPKLYEVNLLGVPQGWKSYATRGYSAQLDLLEREYELARAHAGSTPLFVVYGGGKAVQEHCKANGLIWFDEVMNYGR